MPYVRLLICLIVGMAGNAFAAMPPVLWQAAQQTASVKPVAVIYVDDGSPMSMAHGAAIHHMISQARSEFGLTVREERLGKEDELALRVEKIADEEVGLIAIIEPHNMDALMRLPGLYPDIHFSVIGVPAPLYLTNVHAMRFKDDEGMFMAGALAALASQTSAVAFSSADDGANARNMAYAFYQGAKYAEPGTRILRQAANAKNGEIVLASAGRRSAADVDFILDASLFDAAVSEAKQQKRLLITFDRDLTAAYPGIVLTGVLNHYDLCLHTALKRYRDNLWVPGNEAVGLDEGYIDYVLDSSNKALLSKELIESIEAIKDLVAQGVVKVRPLVP